MLPQLLPPREKLRDTSAVNTISAAIGRDRFKCLQVVLDSPP